MATQEEIEYPYLLKLYVGVVGSMAGMTIDSENEWLLACERISIKLFHHLATLYYLSEGTTLSNLETIRRMSFVDPASLAAVARAALQTYLTFYYNFIDPETPGERIFRNKIWELSGLVERQGFLEENPKATNQFKVERKRTKTLQAEIEQDPLFQVLGAGEQEKLTADKWRRIHDWSNLAQLAGFDGEYFNDIYKYLSSYAYSSESYGTFTESTMGEVIKKELIRVCLHVGLILMGHFIQAYSTIVPRAKRILIQNPFEAEIAASWGQVGRQTIEPESAG
ncbi:hypothetical protein ES708_08220 [subsurface metagenome]